MSDIARAADAEDADAKGADAEGVGDDELTELRLELWAARDAARGAIAEAGTLRARNKELESLIHQLRVEVDRLAHVEKSVTYRVGNTVVRPLRLARKLGR